MIALNIHWSSSISIELCIAASVGDLKFADFMRCSSVFRVKGSGEDIVWRIHVRFV